MNVHRPVTRLPRRERRAQVLDAAAHAFVVGGFAHTSMDDVASVAGVSRLIVYRSFASKEDLYRAVLERVAARLGEEFERIPPQEDQGRGAAGALVRVAREDPEGFRLLWIHAAREPAFASYAAEWRATAVHYADALLEPAIADRHRRTWAAHVVVDHAYDAVLAWLEFGDAADDGACIQLIAASLEGLVTAWSDR